MLKYGGKEQASKWFVQNSQCVRKSQNNKMTEKPLGGLKELSLGGVIMGNFPPSFFPLICIFLKDSEYICLL